MTGTCGLFYIYIYLVTTDIFVIARMRICCGIATDTSTRTSHSYQICDGYYYVPMRHAILVRGVVLIIILWRSSYPRLPFRDSQTDPPTNPTENHPFFNHERRCPPHPHHRANRAHGPPHRRRQEDGRSPCGGGAGGGEKKLER